MKYNLLNIFLILIISCSNSPTNYTTLQPRNDSTTIAKYTNKGFESGKYSELSLAVNGDSLSGVYEYYNGWNSNAKEFDQINVFYFSGIKLSDSTASITATWPGLKKIDGKLRTRMNGISLVLNEMPEGYASLDFTSANGFESQLSRPENWLQILLIKSDKAIVYDTCDVKSKRKGYLIKNDIIKILKREKSWFKIEFDNLSLNKSFFYWIKDDETYNSDVSKW